MSRKVDDDVFTGEMHLRSDLLAAKELLGIPDDLIPTEKEGMFRHQDSSAGAAEHLSEQSTLLSNDRDGNHGQKQAELRIVQRSLEEINRVAHKRIQTGFNEINFTAGVLNCFFIGYVFGVYPQHFWLLYLVEGLVLIPVKFYSFVTAKPLNNAYYFFDFCWVMNVMGLLWLTAFCLDSVFGRSVIFSNQVHEQLFLAAVGISCGPLIGACLVLPFVCLLFHDIHTMADLFIHIFPPMLMFTLRWHADIIKEAWPSVFDLEYLLNKNDDVTFGSVASNAVALYVLWFVAYSIWMVLIGLNLPRSDDASRTPKYDTVFHSLMRGGLCIVLGTSLWGRSKDDSVRHMSTNYFEVRDFGAYMLAHAVCCISTIYLLGYPCFTSHSIHGWMLVLVLAVTTHRGARRYTYYTTTMYGKMLRNHFSDLIDDDEEKGL